VKKEDSWNTYRTRFLIKAKQLREPLKFVDALGREHVGKKGDYLMEWCDGLQRIAPRKFFEDVYVPVESVQPDDVVTLTPLRKLPARAERSMKVYRRQQSA
jgi:hypothetical protein